jgi:hypothetical protein
MDVADPIIQQMRLVAAAAAEKAYCPYSHFPVGAAVLTDTGEVLNASSRPPVVTPPDADEDEERPWWRRLLGR